MTKLNNSEINELISVFDDNFDKELCEDFWEVIKLVSHRKNVSIVQKMGEFAYGNPERLKYATQPAILPGFPRFVRDNPWEYMPDVSKGNILSLLTNIIAYSSRSTDIKASARAIKRIKQKLNEEPKRCAWVMWDCVLVLKTLDQQLYH